MCRRRRSWLWVDRFHRKGFLWLGNHSICNRLYDERTEQRRRIFVHQPLLSSVTFSALLGQFSKRRLPAGWSDESGSVCHPASLPITRLQWLFPAEFPAAECAVRDTLRRIPFRLKPEQTVFCMRAFFSLVVNLLLFQARFLFYLLWNIYAAIPKPIIGQWYVRHQSQMHACEWYSICLG